MDKMRRRVEYALLGMTILCASVIALGVLRLLTLRVH